MPHARMSVRIAAATIVTLTLGGCANDAVAPTAAPTAAAVRVAPDAPSLAKAAGVSDNYTFPVTFDIPVPWDPTNSCGLDSPVHGEGVFRVVAKSAQKPDGSWHVNISWTAHGTAVGDDGSQYTFNYALNAHAKDLTGPNYGLPGDFVTTDHFNLLGKAGAPDLKVSFRAIVNLDGADPTTLALTFTPVDFIALKGEYNCDPI